MNIFDLHCDTFSRMYEEKREISCNCIAVNMSELENFDFAVQTFAVWLGGDEPCPEKKYKSILNNGIDAISRFSGKISVCTNREELTECKDKGKIAAVLSLEGGSPINSAEFVERLYSDGIRTAALTWNGDNQLAGGAYGEKGLTSLGREVILKMNKLGMVLDASHLNRRSFFEAAELADNLVATHSGIDSLVPHKRNLTDEQLRVIGQKKGLIGMCYYPAFAGSDVFDGFYWAVCHICDMGLGDILAAGSDFDGAEMSPALSKPTDVKTLALYLKNRLIDEDTVNNIFFRHAWNYYHKVL